MTSCFSVSHLKKINKTHHSATLCVWQCLTKFCSFRPFERKSLILLERLDVKNNKRIPVVVKTYIFSSRRSSVLLSIPTIAWEREERRQNRIWALRSEGYKMSPFSLPTIVVVSLCFVVVVVCITS